MDTQFVPYELALKLKELGFDRRCFGWYDLKQEDYTPEIRYDFAVMEDYDFEAPLWQQAFDFFREKHDLYCAITSSTMMIDWTYYIFKALNSKPLDNPILEGWSYEEARLECLKKLIGIVKNE